MKVFYCVESDGCMGDTTLRRYSDLIGALTLNKYKALKKPNLSKLQ